MAETKAPEAPEASTPGFNPQNTEQFLNQFVAAVTPLLQTMVQEAVSTSQGKGDGELSETPEEEAEADGEATPEDVDEHTEEEDGDGPKPEGDDMPTEKLEGKEEKRPAVAEKKPEEKKEKPAKYEADTEEMTQYAKLSADERVTQYHKLVGEHRDLKTEYAKLKSEVDGEKSERRKAVRYSKLRDLKSQGFVMDVEEEMAECATIEDTAFERHCDRIATKYQRIPGGIIPVESPKIYDGNSAEFKAKEKAEKYAKQARENVLRERAKGVKIEYKSELARLMAEDAA